MASPFGLSGSVPVSRPGRGATVMLDVSRRRGKDAGRRMVEQKLACSMDPHSWEDNHDATVPLACLRGRRVARPARGRPPFTAAEAPGGRRQDRLPVEDHAGGALPAGQGRVRGKGQELGAEVIFDSANNNEQTQLAKFENMLAKGAQVIVCSPSIPARPATWCHGQRGRRPGRRLQFDADQRALDVMVMQDSWAVGKLQGEALSSGCRRRRARSRARSR